MVWLARDKSVAMGCTLCVNLGTTYAAVPFLTIGVQHTLNTTDPYTRNCGKYSNYQLLDGGRDCSERAENGRRNRLLTFATQRCSFASRLTRSCRDPRRR